MQGAGTSIVLQDCLSYTSLHLCATLIFGKMFPHASCQRSVSFDVNGNLVLCCQHVDCDNINMVRLVKKRGVPVQNGTPPLEARTPPLLRVRPHGDGAYPNPIFFFPWFKKKFRPHGAVSRNIYIHTKPVKPTENDVVYMPDQYVALYFCHRYTKNGEEELELGLACEERGHRWLSSVVLWSCSRDMEHKKKRKKDDKASDTLTHYTKC